MSLKWREVIEKPEYQALSLVQQNEAKLEYFSRFVATQVTEEERLPAFQAFAKFSNYNPPQDYSTGAGLPPPGEPAPTPTTRKRPIGATGSFAPTKPGFIKEMVLKFIAPQGWNDTPTEYLESLAGIAAGSVRAGVKGLTMGYSDIYEIVPALAELEAKYLRPGIQINDKDPIITKIGKAIQRDPNIIAKIPSNILGALMPIGVISKGVVAARGIPRVAKQLFAHAVITGGAYGAAVKPYPEKAGLVNNLIERGKNSIKHSLFFAGATGLAIGLNRIANRIKLGKMKSYQELKEAVYKHMIDSRGFPRDEFNVKMADSVIDDLVNTEGGLPKMSKHKINRGIKRVRKMMDPAAPPEAPPGVTVSGPLELPAPTGIKPLAAAKLPAKGPPVKPKPVSLNQFIRKQGGVNTSDHLITDFKHAAGKQPGLISKQGKSLDQMREAAVEAGYIGVDSTVNDFIGLVETDAKTKAVYFGEPRKLPEQQVPKYETEQMATGEADLRLGDSFTVHGSKYTVTGRDENKLALQGDGETFKADTYFDKIAIDRGLEGIQRAGSPKPIPTAFTSEEITPEIEADINALSGKLRLSDLDSEVSYARAMTAAYKQGWNRGRIRLLADKRYLQTMRKQTAKAINTIRSMPTKKLPVEIKKKIEALKVGVDPKARSKKTIAEYIRIENYIKKMREQGESIYMPERILKAISTKSVSQLTPLELDYLARGIKQLAHIGGNVGRFRAIRQRKQINAVVDELIVPMKKLKGPGRIPPDFPITETTKKQFMKPGGIKTALRTHVLKDMRPERVHELLDAFKDDGPNYKTVIEPIEEASSKSYGEQLTKTERIREAVKKFNLKLGKIVSIKRTANDRVQVTGEEAMEVYLATFDRGKLLHLLVGNRLSRQDISDIVATLSPNEKGYVEWELMNYWKPQHGEVGPVYEALTNNVFPQIPGYSRIITDRELSEYAPYEENLLNELLGREELIAAQADRPFTLGRTGAAEQPLSLRHFDNLIRNIEQVAHFKAFGLTARDLRRIIKHPKYKKAVIDSAGKTAYDIVEKSLSDVITRRPYLETSAAPIMAALRRNAAVFMLGLKVVTSLKQLGSLNQAVALSDMQTILHGVKRVMTDPKGVEKIVYSKSPPQKERAVERDIKELLRRAKASKVLSGKHTLSAASMSLIRYMDKKAVLSVWIGEYETAISGGLPEKQAVALADKLVRRTQPAFETKDLWTYARGGELEKMVTMFTNMKNITYNNFISDVVGKAKFGEISKMEAFRRLWWIWFSSAIFLGGVTRGRVMRSPKELLFDIGKFSPLAGSFIVGSVLEAALSDWEWSLPSMQLFKEIGWAFAGKEWATRAKHGAKVAGLASGLPLSQPITTATGMIDLLNNRTDDPRRLIWTKSALEDEPVSRGRRTPRAGGGRREPN